jgi:hypothetical protein
MDEEERDGPFGFEDFTKEIAFGLRDRKSAIVDSFRWIVTLFGCAIVIWGSCAIGKTVWIESRETVLVTVALIGLGACTFIGSFLGGLLMMIDEKEYERSHPAIRLMRDFGVWVGIVLGAIVGATVGFVLFVHLLSVLGFPSVSKDTVRPDSLTGIALGYYWDDPICQKYLTCPDVMEKAVARARSDRVGGSFGTNASVVYAGNTTNVILNFTIPQGTPGVPGNRTEDLEKKERTSETEL